MTPRLPSGKRPEKEMKRLRATKISRRHGKRMPRGPTKYLRRSARNRLLGNGEISKIHLIILQVIPSAWWAGSHDQGSSGGPMLTGDRFGRENEFAELAGNGCSQLDGLGWIFFDVEARFWWRSFDEWTGPMQIDEKAATRGVVGRVRRIGIPRDVERQNAFAVV